MKTTNPSLPLLPILVIFLLSALAANPLLLDTSAADVLDFDGDVVMAGQPYNIVSFWGGGLRVACTNQTGTTCPLDIVKLPVDYGLPFTFSPVNKSAVAVQESTDLSIISPGVSNCSIENSTMWGLQYDQSKRKYFVTSCAPAEGNPGCANRFRLVKVTCLGPEEINFYKIVFCSTLCGNSNVVCIDIGSYSDAKRRRRLVLRNKPYVVGFRKHHGRVSTITTVSTMISNEN